ncbi:MAG: response regulator [SAR202 cluster bacterium]|nr:response regulator [SAR202 cluster bacterium]
MSTPLRILMTEDSEDDAIIIVRMISRAGYQVTFERADSINAFHAALTQQKWDIILADYNVPTVEAPEALRLIARMEADIPVIVVSGVRGEEVAVQVMRAGARDFVGKDELFRLVPAIDRELKEAHDRKARKAAEAHIRSIEEQLRLLADRSSDFIYRYSFKPKRGFQFVSKASTALTGYTPEEHYGDPDLGLKIVHPDDRERMLRIVEEGTGFETPMELRWIKKNGTVIWTESVLTPIYDNVKEVIAFEGIARDITIRRNTELQYRLLASQLETMNKVAKAVIQQGTLEERVALVLEEMRVAAGADSARLWIPSSREDQLQVLAQVGRVLPGDRIVVPVSHSLAGAAYRSNDLVVVNDYTKFEAAFDDRIALGIRSGLAVPVVVNDDVLASITLASMKSDHFTEERVTIVTAINPLVASTLRQAQLLDDLERRNNFLEQKLKEIHGLNNLFQQQLDTQRNADLIISEHVSELEHTAESIQRMLKQMKSLAENVHRAEEI